MANIVIKRKQSTIIWHIDDIKILHADKDVVENIIKKLTTKFGQAVPLTTSRGKVLDYLAIKINYQRKFKVTFSMEEYINKKLEEALYDMEGIKTLAACHLFNVNNSAKNLSEEKAQLSYGSETSIFMQKNMTRHTNDHGLSMY